MLKEKCNCQHELNHTPRCPMYKKVVDPLEKHWEDEEKETSEVPRKFECEGECQEMELEELLFGCKKCYRKVVEKPGSLFKKMIKRYGKK